MYPGCPICAPETGPTLGTDRTRVRPAHRAGMFALTDPTTCGQPPEGPSIGETQIMYWRFRISTIALLAVFALSPAHGKWVQKRIVPVAVESCAGKEGQEAVTKLFDGKVTVQDKWCCFHGGYNTEQVHWVAVDLGKVYPLDKVVIYHESFIDPASSHLVTEDFVVQYGEASISGPWKELAAIRDNTQSRTEIPASRLAARFLRLEVTDPQSLNEPGRANQDWALRLLEWEIFAWESESEPSAMAAAAVPATSPTPQARPTASPATVSGVPAQTAAAPILYFFYRGDHQPARTFYNYVVLKRENWNTVGRYRVVPLEIGANQQQATQMGVFKSPTCIIAEADGRKKADLAGVPQEAEFLDFLNTNLAR